jgi:hypothetical protein
MPRAFAILFLVASPAFASPWPGVPYAEVRGYAYNYVSPVFDVRGRQLMNAPLVDENGQLGSSVANKSGARLSPEQVQRLIHAIIGMHPAHLTARCWKPHHGFVFYDTRGKAVAWVEVCFECGFTRPSPTVPNHSYDDMDALRKLSKELKLLDQPPQKT